MVERLYGIRPDFCLALRLIATQELHRRNAEFVETILMAEMASRDYHREIADECDRLRAEIERLTTLGADLHADRLNMMMTIERLTRERDAVATRLENALVEGAKRREERDAAERQVATLRKALEFYESPYEWLAAHGEEPRVPDFWDEMDFGERARAALAATEGKDV